MSDHQDSYDELLARMGARPSVTASKERDALIRRDCTSSLAPAPSFPRWQRIASCAVLAGLVIASLAVLWRDDGVHHSTRYVLYGTAGWALVLFSVLLVGFGPQGARTAKWRMLAAVSIPLLFFGYLSTCQSNWLPLSTFLSQPAACAGAFRCGVIALGLGAGSALGVLWLWRRTDPFNPGWSGALAGLVGGLAGALSIGLVCPDGGVWHLWLGHGVGMVVLLIFGATLGRRLLAP